MSQDLVREDALMRWAASYERNQLRAPKLAKVEPEMLAEAEYGEDLSKWLQGAMLRIKHSGPLVAAQLAVRSVSCRGKASLTHHNTNRRPNVEGRRPNSID